jgi:hypothetical protein
MRARWREGVVEEMAQPIICGTGSIIAEPDQLLRIRINLVPNYYESGST